MFKKSIRKIHKWLGLLSGLIVFIVSITGCIFCFHDEIKDITRKEWRFVTPENKSYVAPSVLEAKAKELLPDATPSFVSYVGRNRWAGVYSANANTHDSYYLYFNPYTGEHLQTEHLESDFFVIIEKIHMYLYLPEDIGKHIVGVATIVFILLLITGIIQWWPKKMKDFKRNLSIKWSAKWRRVNYDWHNTTGFYVSIIALVIAVTGLTFTYDWMGDALYESFNLGKGNRQTEMIAPKFKPNSIAVKANPMDKAMETTFEQEKKGEMFFVMIPTDKKSAIITGAYPHSLRYDQQSNYYFHPQTGETIKKTAFKDKSLGLQVVEINYGLHTGQILDLPGKIIAFIASLLAAILPLSGFLIWYGRNYKSKKNPLS